MEADTSGAALALGWALFVATPFSALLFLTTFLVNLGRWGDDTRFTHFCERAQLPAFGLLLVCLVLTARYF